MKKSGLSKASPLFGANFRDPSALCVHVGCLGALGTLNHIKLYCLPFFQGFKSGAFDGAEVDEDIRPILLRDETKAFLIIEPFHSSFRHDLFLLSLKLWVLPTHVLHLPWVRNARTERIRHVANFWSIQSVMFPQGLTHKKRGTICSLLIYRYAT